ncbi:hypothetical protein ANN_09517 [Periplaneta americana]|uniref:Uncharacterized protein n=1 Tax=Periplaneta americana TaxID=6978 RepID=A0ABQ8TQ55_PERAM|nr:hypothetical protein ANN_09517 [Periplaneta americana]
MDVSKVNAMPGSGRIRVKNEENWIANMSHRQSMQNLNHARENLPTPDTLTNQEKADNLLQQYFEEQELSAKLPDPADEIAQRLAKLRGQNIPSNETCKNSPANETSKTENKEMWEVYKEGHCISDNGSNHRADIIAIDRSRGRGLILAPTIRMEKNTEQAMDVNEEKGVIYHPCAITYLLMHGRDKMTSQLTMGRVSHRIKVRKESKKDKQEDILSRQGGEVKKIWVVHLLVRGRKEEIRDHRITVYEVGG